METKEVHRYKASAIIAVFLTFYSQFFQGAQQFEYEVMSAPPTMIL